MMIPSLFKRMFDFMYENIGGESNPDMKTYRERSKIITRNVFFRETVWAIWVAGKSRKSADKFLNRAMQQGFVYDFQTIASWNNEKRASFVESLHGWVNERGRLYHRQVPNRAIGIWNSIFFIADELANSNDDQTFRKRFFNGKVASSSLDTSDVRRLVNMNIPYLKEVTANFLIRNIGAEAIKADRWVNEFLRWVSLTKH